RRKGDRVCHRRRPFLAYYIGLVELPGEVGKKREPNERADHFVDPDTPGDRVQIILSVGDFAAISLADLGEEPSKGIRERELANILPRTIEAGADGSSESFMGQRSRQIDRRI